MKIRHYLKIDPYTTSDEWLFRFDTIEGPEYIKIDIKEMRQEVQWLVCKIEELHSIIHRMYDQDEVDSICEDRDQRARLDRIEAAMKGQGVAK